MRICGAGAQAVVLERDVQGDVKQELPVGGNESTETDLVSDAEGTSHGGTYAVLSAD